MTTNGQAGSGQITGNVLFYSQPEPLAPETHGKLGVKRMDGPFKFAKAGHAIPLTVGEFPLAAVTGPHPAKTFGRKARPHFCAGS